MSRKMKSFMALFLMLSLCFSNAVFAKNLSKESGQDSAPTKFKKGEVTFTQKTKKFKRPVKGAVLQGMRDDVSYFADFKKTGIGYYMNDAKKYKKVYNIKKFDFGFFSELYGDDLIVGITGGEKKAEGDWAFSFHRINKNGGKVIYKGNGSGMPQSRIIDDSLIFYTYDKKKEKAV